MSTQFGMPSRLTEFEAKLRQQSPVEHQINRDELMYKAGWAAAEVARKVRWGWPATSGVLAAAVLVMGIFIVHGSQSLPLDKPIGIKAESISVEAMPSIVYTTQPKTQLEPQQHWEDELLVLSRRYKLKDWDSLAVTGFDGVAEDSWAEVKTARALMNEFLQEAALTQKAEAEPSQDQLETMGDALL